MTHSPLSPSQSSWEGLLATCGWLCVSPGHCPVFSRHIAGGRYLSEIFSSTAYNASQVNKLKRLLHIIVRSWYMVYIYCNKKQFGMQFFPVLPSICIWLCLSAYRAAYGEDVVWKHYRRNFKGHFKPETRKKCIVSLLKTESIACLWGFTWSLHFLSSKGIILFFFFHLSP